MKDLENFMNGNRSDPKRVNEEIEITKIALENIFSIQNGELLFVKG